MGDIDIIDNPLDLKWKWETLDFGNTSVDLWCPQFEGFCEFKAGDWRRRGGVDKEEIGNFKAFQEWKKTMQDNLRRQKTDDKHPHHARPCSLKSIHISSITRFPPGASGLSSIGFVKMDAWIQRDPAEEQKPKSMAGAEEAKDPNAPPTFPINYDNTLYESVFSRGGSIAVLMILRPSDKRSERWVILTEQSRVPACSLRFVEISAGMMDAENNFKGVAAREIEEETGLKIPESELINMIELALDGSNDPENLVKAMYPSPGGCDEHISLFLWEKVMDGVHIEALKGKITGLRMAGEAITLRLEKYDNLWKVGARDAKTLGAWALYEGLSNSDILDQRRKPKRVRTGTPSVAALLNTLKKRAPP